VKAKPSAETRIQEAEDKAKAMKEALMWLQILVAQGNKSK